MSTLPKVFQKTPPPVVRDHSPWGAIDEVQRVAAGIYFVTTASHGGYLVSPERMAALPEAIRAAYAPPGELMGGGAFEEDCDAALVVLAFPDAFPAGAQARARAHVAGMARYRSPSWNHQRWEAVNQTFPAYETEARLRLMEGGL